MLQLPAAASVSGDETAWIVQGGVDKYIAISAIANTASGFVPVTREISTPAAGGLAGGGTLAANLSLTFNPNGLTAKTAMAVADSFAINDVAGGNVPKQSTFPNAMKALTGLTALGVPNLSDDYLIINHAADGLTYKISPSGLSLATGNVPAGGLTNQFLAKASNTDYDTIWTNSSVLLDALSLAGNPTGSSALNTSITLGSTLAFSGTSLQTGAGSGDVSWSANSFVTAIGNNKVTDAMLRQSSGLSVIGRSASTTGNVADITGTANQVLRVDSGGTTLGFGSIDLSQSATVGSSILAGANGGTGVANTGKTITLGGNLTLSGAYDVTFTFTGITGVTFPTSGTLATTGGASIPVVAQGDLLYGSAINVLSALAKDTNATRYLSNTGTSNNPAWAQVALANGVSGQLPLANGGTNANLTASDGGIFYSTASAAAILAGTSTANQVLLSGSSTTPAWSTATYPAAASAGTILAAGTSNTISGTSTPTLGASGTLGSVTMGNATSGLLTLQPATGALGTVTVSIPAATDTLVNLASSQALTNKTYNGLTITSSTGTLTIANGKTATVSNSLTFTGTDSTSFAFPSTSSTVLTTGNTATTTVGYTVTPYNGGTVSSGTFTVTPSNGNYQYYTNNGAHTLAAPSSDCAVDILVTNGASAGSITFSGFTVGSSTGSSLTTTNTNKFLISVRRINSVSTYSIYALQ